MGTADASRLTRHTLDATFAQWLDAHADTLDASADSSADVIPQLARAGVLRIGVPASLGVVQLPVTIETHVREATQALFCPLPAPHF